MNETATSFAGFDSPTAQYFPLPNSWVNVCAQITNLAELKVLTYVARHTWGYHEYDVARPFTLDEFMRGRKRRDGSRMDQGTGLSRQGVVDGLQRALADGYLICEADETDRGRIKKCYRLKMREEQTSAPAPAVSKADASSQQNRHQVSEMQTSEVKHGDTSSQHSRQQQSEAQIGEVNKVDSSGHEHRPRSEKDTQEKQPKKKTYEKQGKKDTCEKQAMDAHAPSLSAEAQVVYDAWCSLFTVEVPLTPANARAAQALARPVARWAQELAITPTELLRRMIHWLYETDKTGYYQRGVKLPDLAREFEAWQTAQERKMRKKSGRRPVPTLHEDPYSLAALIAAQNPRYFAESQEAQEEPSGLAALMAAQKSRYSTTQKGDEQE
jgi:hypothetical protein